MPKAALSQEDREHMREKILEEALKLISEYGFTSFSMRNLASRLGLTATTIYHYYSNKDELYLMILTKGFEMLYERFEEISRSGQQPSRKIIEAVKAYVDFGIHKAHYYNIMFTSDAPKYRDYIGTDIEPVAYLEKQTALKLFDITTQTLLELEHETGSKSFHVNDTNYFVIKLWSTLHGIIALYNSRVLAEVVDDADALLEQITQDLVASLFSQLGLNIQ